MGKISAVINIIEEELSALPRVIASLEGFADEIVIVDMTSGTKLNLLVKDKDVKVFKYKFVEYVEPARNFGISKATNDWILIIDPDEEIPKLLQSKLKELTRNSEINFVRIPRKNIVFGKWLEHSRWWPDYNIRFFKKGKVSWSDEIHAVPLTQGKGEDIPTKEDFSIIHYHYQNIEQYISRMNRYTSKQVNVLIDKGYKFNWKDLIKKPANEFYSRFYFGKGYKDGVHGLAVSLLQSFSEFVLYLKIWQNNKFKDEELSLSETIETIRISELESHYWQADSLINEGGGLIQRLKRKLKLP